MSKSAKTDAKLYKKTKTVKGVEYESWVARQYHNGKPVECSASTQIEALQRLAQKINDIDSGAIGISSKMTVKRWAETWLETYKKPILRNKQYQDYLSTINKVIVPEIGSLRLTEITDTHLQIILNSKAGQSKDRLGKLRNRMNAMFKQAYITKLIKYNPAQYLTLPQAKDGTHRSITENERKHFLKVAETHHAGLMFKTMLYCGLRTGEVVALDWRNIDFKKKRIKVTGAMESGTNDIKEPKTAAGIREIPIPIEIYNELKERKGDPFEPVFTRPDNKGRYTNMSRSRAWQSIKKEMDISMGAKFEKRKAKDGKMRMKQIMSFVTPDLVPYCLRHTYCTDLQDKGVPINIAKYLMGHANISVTASIYTHISDTAIDTAAKLINGENSESSKQENGENHGEEKIIG